MIMKKGFLSGGARLDPEKKKTSKQDPKSTEEQTRKTEQSGSSGSGARGWQPHVQVATGHIADMMGDMDRAEQRQNERRIRDKIAPLAGEQKLETLEREMKRVEMTQSMYSFPKDVISPAAKSEFRETIEELATLLGIRK